MRACIDGVVIAARMQADIEGSEVAAFDRRTAARFMTEIDVIAIQMEWFFMSHGRIANETVDRMLDFFADLDYAPHAIDDRMTSLDVGDWYGWPGNVMFVKRKSFVELFPNAYSYGSITSGQRDGEARPAK